MNDPFSEVLLREDVLITDKTPHSTTGCSWTIPAGLCILRKVGGSEVGLRDGQGCPEEHWDKTLMLTITGQEARDRGKRTRTKWSWKCKELQGTSSLLMRRVCGIKSRSAWRVRDSAPWGSTDIST